MAKNMANARATNSEKEFRTLKIAKLLAEGATRSEIKQYALKTWKIKDRQTQIYINDATEILKADWDIDRREFTAALLSQLATLQREARANNMPHIALGCINTAAKIAHILS